MVWRRGDGGSEGKDRGLSLTRSASAGDRLWYAAIVGLPVMSVDDPVRAFNKCIKHLIGMLGVDCPGEAFVPLMRVIYKTVKTIKVDYMYSVYQSNVTPVFGDDIRNKRPYFLTDDGMKALPLAAWMVPYLQKLYDSLPAERIDEYWVYLQKL